MPRDVLVAVVGEAPAIVTETLWAAAFGPERDPERPFRAEAIHLIATRRGRDVIEERLLGPEGGLAQYRQAWNPDTPEPEIIDVELDGGPIEDVTTVEESIAVADRLVALLSRLSEDEDCRIYASMAGGRKTMGFFLGYAMSLFARPQDRLTHVLVHPSVFEQCPDFWFPMPKDRFADREPRLVEYKHETGIRTCDAAEARVTLSDLPYVRLRYQLEPRELRQLAERGFAAVVEAVAQALRPHKLILRCSDRSVTVGPFRKQAPNHEFAMIWVLAEAAATQRPGAGPEGHGQEHQGWLTADDFRHRENATIGRYAEIYYKTYKDRRADAFSGEANKINRKKAANVKNTWKYEDFAEVKSKSSTFLRRLITNKIMQPTFSIQLEEDPAPSRFGFNLPPEQIELIDDVQN